MKIYIKKRKSANYFVFPCLPCVKMSILSEHNLFNYTNVPSLAGLAGSKVINTSLDGNLKCIRSFAR